MSTTTPTHTSAATGQSVNRVKASANALEQYLAQNGIESKSVVNTRKTWRQTPLGDVHERRVRMLIYYPDEGDTETVQNLVERFFEQDHTVDGEFISGPFFSHSYRHVPDDWRAVEYKM